MIKLIKKNAVIVITMSTLVISTQPGYEQFRNIGYGLVYLSMIMALLIFLVSLVWTERNVTKRTIEEEPKVTGLGMSKNILLCMALMYHGSIVLPIVYFITMMMGTVAHMKIWELEEKVLS